MRTEGCGLPLINYVACCCLPGILHGTRCPGTYSPSNFFICMLLSPLILRAQGNFSARSTFQLSFGLGHEP